MIDAATWPAAADNSASQITSCSTDGSAFPISAYLVSDAASHLTGQIVHVQGRQLSTFKISLTDGVSPRSGDRWSPEEIRERWGEIVR